MSSSFLPQPGTLYKHDHETDYSVIKLEQDKKAWTFLTDSYNDKVRILVPSGSVVMFLCVVAREGGRLDDGGRHSAFFLWEDRILGTNTEWFETHFAPVL